MSDEPASKGLYARASPVVQGVAALLRRGNRVEPVRRLGVGLNRAVLRSGAWLLGRQPGVTAVLSRHSALTEDFTPWVSDLDLDVVIADEQDRPTTPQAVWQTFAFLKRCYPLFGELEVQSARELAAWQRWGGVEALEARHWTALVGDVPRRTVAPTDAGLTDIHITVECFNLLFWQLYGIIFSPSFSGAAFQKVFAKLQRMLWCRPDNLEEQIRRSRRSVLAELGETEPEMAALLAQIACRQYRRMEEDVVEALQFLLEQLLARLPAPAAPAPSNLAVTMDHERPTRELVWELVAPATTAVRRIDGITDAVLLSGRLGDSGALGSYDYKLYLCLAENELPHWAQRLAQVRAEFDRHRHAWPFNYFGACSLPMVVSDRAFRFAVDSWDPIEGIEHGLRTGRPVSPSPRFVERSLAYFCNSNRHHRGFGFNSPFTDRVREDFGAELTLVDYVMTLAQLRLALEHQQLGVTPGDVVQLYRDRLPEPHERGDELRQWWLRYGSLRPQDMRGALDMARLVAEAQPLLHCQREALFRWLAARAED
ncbi:MAG: hypothetical protein JRI68_01160 [Deltaproteobacteria bacterium]|nr:hypothetical protein [Deltaproteobacteria bacterium]